MSTNTLPNTIGRIDQELNVYVVDRGVERRIGQMPGKTEQEAQEFFSRKYDELSSQVRLLEQRISAGVNPAALIKTFEKLNADLIEPMVLGDLEALRERMQALLPRLEELKVQRAEANKAALASAIAAREAIVIEAENLAVSNPKRVWKTDSAKMVSLFEQWQALQKNSPKFPKPEADVLWKRFSAARKSFDNQKRAFFAAADSAAKEAKAKKADLVSKAEAIAATEKPSVIEYRKLLDAWKLTGRSNGKGDDALWAAFKAAGDKIYASRAAEVAEQGASQAEALKVKLALLEEAKAIDAKKNLSEAKRLLADIQKRWAAAGRVSKEALRETEDKLRAIEKSVREVEQEQWRRSDPAAKERTNDVLVQLQASIETLRADLSKAKATGDVKKISEAESALATREAWLEVVQANNA